MIIGQGNMQWPSLRDELALYPGPVARDGSPSWSLHDPLRNLYFRIDFLTLQILSRWHLQDADAITAALAKETTLHIAPEAVQDVVQFLEQSELVKRDSIQANKWLIAEKNRRKVSKLKWLLHHYLFFRLPLWKPDAWLTKTLPLVKPLYTNMFFLLSLFALLFGLLQVSLQWDLFSSSLIDTFSLKGLLGYSITLICVKFLHELGHAYTAKRHGCKVPTIGVAFLVLFPMAYTDVNDAWKLPRQRDRLAIGSAGIVTELLIAAWATLAWSMLPDGVLKHAAFLLATTTWISTLVINASPFLRFDGYFLLMDKLELPNLHQRSFALTRWQLREWLFGLNEPIPEHFSSIRHKSLLFFAGITWLYRLLVFSGIAVLVYVMVPKPLGPALAAIEIWWFILLPVWSEVSEWLKRARNIMQTRRSLITLLLLFLFILLMVVPWDRRISSQGLLQPGISMPLVSPSAAMLEKMLLSDRSTVHSGQSVVTLNNPDLQFQLLSAKARIEGLQWRIDMAGVAKQQRAQQQVNRAARDKVAAEIMAIKQEIERHTLHAPIDGVIYWASPDLQAGAWIQKNQALIHVVDPVSWQVHAYFSEHELSRIRIGDTGRFYTESDRLEPLTLTVKRIDTDATRILNDGLLASVRGGELLVREKGGQLIPETALYRVALELELEEVRQLGENHLPSLRGDVVIDGQPKAWLSDYLRAIAALWRRESGF